jgi:hypothetical protein
VCDKNNNLLSLTQLVKESRKAIQAAEQKQWSELEMQSSKLL